MANQKLASDGTAKVSSPPAEDTRASYTIKVSTIVREYIENNTTVLEPVDRTLRRLLGLPIQPGSFLPKTGPKKKSKGRKKVIWTTIKVTEVVRNHITAKAEWNRSVDHTLRRLFKLPIED